MNSGKEIREAAYEKFCSKRPRVSVPHEAFIAGWEARTEWWPMSSAPRDGSAFLAFGIHDTDNGPHWGVGDEWIAILVFNVWRDEINGGERFVFSKDGDTPWSEPQGWLPLPHVPKLRR